MNNNIKILYNNVDLFSGIAPTPFISLDQDFVSFNTGWNQITKISMEGQLTGRYLSTLSYYELTSGFNLLVNRLSNNYGTLVISENSENLFSGDNVIIDSISTDETNWYGILPFTINFEVYETGLFTNYYGVVEPQENIDFSEEDGLITNLTHTISARGLKTGSNNAITSAKNWVNSRTGNYNKIIPVMLQTGNGSEFLLNSVKESIDRFNGTYQWEGNYVKSNFVESPRNAILSYSLDLSSGIEDGLVNVNLQGSLKNNNVTGSNSLRSGYFNYDFYNIANEASLKTFGTRLNKEPINQSVNEEYNNNVLNFNLSYNSDLISNIINNYTVTIDTDSIKNISTVNLRSRIYGKYGTIANRWNLVQQYYNTNFNPFSLANTEYIKEKNRTLSPNTITESVTFNEYSAEIEYNGSWSNKKINYSSDILQFTSSVSYTPAVSIYSTAPSITTKREHNVYRLGTANRSLLDITVSANVKYNKSINVGISQVNAELARIKNIYEVTTNFLLIDRKETRNISTNTYSINEKYSYEGDILV